MVLAASLLAWKVHSGCVFICEQQKWENVPVGGGSQYINTFFLNVPAADQQAVQRASYKVGLCLCLITCVRSHTPQH